MKYYLTAIFVVLFDQIVKFLIRSSMYIGESIPVIKNLFYITYIRNSGAAFSMLIGKRLILIGIPLVAIVFGVWYLKKHMYSNHWTFSLALSLIIGGGIGNLIDRIFLSSVTDLFDFRVFPVFNIADIAVCIGCGMLILFVLIFEKNDSKKVE